jgi:heterodisulfide reductase subunit C1
VFRSNTTMHTLVERLISDFRMVEGLKACISCGTCTAVCPAASVSEYDPRLVLNMVQEHREESLIALLKSNTIWLCGECLSCKTRCPRENIPGYVIQALRSLSIETGYFMDSKQGRKQLALKRTIGEHILKYGYCVYIDEINSNMYPEQGPIWDWIQKNRQNILERLGSSYGKAQSGSLRIIPEESIRNLQKIFDETGATKRFEHIEDYAKHRADIDGIDFDETNSCDYFRMMYED